MKVATVGQLDPRTDCIEACQLEHNLGPPTAVIASISAVCTGEQMLPQAYKESRMALMENQRHGGKVRTHGNIELCK